jgi:hypothetical protein
MFESLHILCKKAVQAVDENNIMMQLKERIVHSADNEE